MKKSKKLIALAAALALTVGGAVSVSAGTANFGANLKPFGVATTITQGRRDDIGSTYAKVYVTNITNNYSSVYTWVDDSSGNLRSLQHVITTRGENSLKYSEHVWKGGATLRGDNGNKFASYYVWVDGWVNFG